jgi:hypothetical protein
MQFSKMKLLYMFSLQIHGYILLFTTDVQAGWVFRTTHRVGVKKVARGSNGTKNNKIPLLNSKGESRIPTGGVDV